MPAYTGDVTSPAGSTVNTLPTVNANIGTFNNITINAKGQATAGSNVAYVTGGPYLPLVGGTLSNGLHFGSAIAGSAADTSRHITLYDTGYGFSITSGTLNVVAGGTAHAFTASGATITGGLTATGVINTGSNYLTFQNGSATLGNGGGPLIYGDGNWIIAKLGSGNLGLAVYDYAGNEQLQLRSDGTILAKGTGNSGQFRMAPNISGTSYGSFWRNDGSSTYLLLTNVNDASGSWNGLRPFTVDNSNGNVSMGGTLTLSGGVQMNAAFSVANNNWVFARDTSNNPFTVLGMYTDNQVYIGDSGHTMQVRGNYVMLQTHLAAQTDNAYFCGSGGHAWVQCAAYSYPGSSDLRLKTNNQPLPDDCLALVRAIVPQRFCWRKGPDPERVHWGFIAQEVAAAMSAAGHEFGGHYVGDDEAKTQSLDVNELVAVLWRAVQEMAATLEVRA
jgi:hypothetical protein